MSKVNSFTILNNNGKVIAHYNKTMRDFQISPDEKFIFDGYQVFVNPLYDKDHDKIPDDEDVLSINNDLLYQLSVAFGVSFVFTSLYEWRRKRKGIRAHEEYLRLKGELERRELR